MPLSSHATVFPPGSLRGLKRNDLKRTLNAERKKSLRPAQDERDEGDQAAGVRASGAAARAEEAG